MSRTVVVPDSPGWFEAIERDFQLGPEHQAVLQLARDAYDRYVQIKEELDRTGVMEPGRYEGVDRISPLVSAEIRARAALIAAIKALNLT